MVEAMKNFFVLPNFALRKGAVVDKNNFPKNKIDMRIISITVYLS